MSDDRADPRSSGYSEPNGRHGWSNGNGEVGSGSIRRLQLYSWSELESLKVPPPLIKGLLDTTALSLVYGAPNCGKTFFVVDIACRIALGMQWRGRPLKQGMVVYIAAEAGRSIKRRFEAFKRKHVDNINEARLFVLPEVVDLCSPTHDVDSILATLQARLGGEKVALIVIDTLSRTFGGCSENSSDDMGAFVRNCDRLRHSTGAHVMIVHHMGKEEKRGARGHSSLEAAVDTAIAIAKQEDGLIAARITKQRDQEQGEGFAFRLESVVLDTDEDGEPITSCVVLQSDDEPRARKGEKSIPPSARRALELLRNAIIKEGKLPPSNDDIPSGVPAVEESVWRRYCFSGQITESDSDGSRRQAFGRAARKLEALGIIRKWNRWVWIVP